MRISRLHFFFSLTSGCLLQICSAAPDLSASYHQEILPIFERYCYDCHGDGIKKGELALDKFGDIPSMIANRDVWKRIRDHIDFRLMPPPDEDSPETEEREKLLAWIDAAVFPVDPKNPDPGHVTLRRLNRTEYQNTLRDLLGVSVDVNEILPQDDSGYGFDNIGDVLTLSPLHLERYLTAAQTALEKATHPGPMPTPQIRISGRDLRGDGHRSDAGRYLSTHGEAYSEIPVAAPGRYRIHVSLSGEWAAGQPPLCDLLVSGKVLETWKVKNTQAQIYTHELTLDKAGPLRIAAAFTNDAYTPEHPDPNQRDRNLSVHGIRLEGPLDGPQPRKPATHRHIYGEQKPGQSDADYLTEVLTRFGRRAFRRPLAEGEIERYQVFLDIAKANGEDVQYAIRDALGAMLASPSFLFREEPPADGEKAGLKLISEHALASRLSYFLWSSMPDDELLALADAGNLRKNLHAETRRMMQSRKAKALVENFVGQWLQLRDLDAVSPDRRRFPDFDRNLARDMRTETEMLVSHVIRENLPAITLLKADFSFLNERLAKHYSIPGVDGRHFRQVSLEGTSRRGLLGHGSVLTLTSHPTRTSPVLRGKYILENILDTPPPPPPPNIPQLTPPSRHGEQISLREQMERHRDDPSCSSCHALMDPIGFGMEKFDAVGAWRDTERGGGTIDTAGKLVTGQSFADAAELRDIIVRDHHAEFHRALASKMLTYALGRGLEWYDRPAIDGVVTAATANEGRFLSLIQAVIDSVPFQYRR
jgi:hypothetical protein